ncbi:nuclear exosome regulator NRDE2 [Brachyhypopomus gauderio]|uniref:nuclear exosome regulator NRDE2 n=1 Tax=Brachyhypopomus gauderio TaxID=698409 RepID=UPI004043870E
MALFPAFEGALNVDSSRNRDLEWLNNQSFREDDALNLHQRASCPASPPSPQSPPSLQKPEEQDNYDVGTKKRRKKEKKKKGKKQKQQKRGCSESGDSDSHTVYPSDLLKKQETPDRAESPIQAGGFMWLDDLHAPTATPYCIDRRADRANWEYRALYRAHIARYRRKGSSALGLDSRTQAVVWDDSAAGKKRRDQKPERYFSPSVRRLLQGEAVPSLPDAPLPEPAPFIPLGNHNEDAGLKPSDSLNPLGVYDSSTSLWLEGKGQPQVKDNVPQPPENSGTKAKVEEFNRTLRENPTDTPTWLAFIRFQDEVGAACGSLPDGQESEAEARRLSVRALLERKVSIIERALESNPGSVELKLEKLRLCQELWEPTVLLKEWKKLVFIHPNSAPLWRSYLLFAQSHFSTFSVSKVNAIYGKCLSTLSAVQDGSMVSHPSLPGTQEDMLDIFLLQCHFLRQAGHSEKAVSLFQALLDFTFFKPDSLKDQPTRQQVEFFEPFWDSGEPRVGERGARGWRAWMLQQERGGWIIPPESEEEEDEDQDESEIKDKTQPKWRIWLDVEATREANQWLPWRPDSTKDQSEEDCEDPDRQVLFDDIGPSMVRVETPQLQGRLVLSFLRFLGLPGTSSPPDPSLLLDDSAFLDERVDPERPLTSYDLPVSGVSAVGHMTFLSSSRRRAGLCKAGEELLRNVLEQILPLLSAQDRAALNLCWLQYEKLKVLRCVQYKNKKRLKVQGKSSKRLAKCLLKQQENRGSLALWREYGHMEWLLGNVEEARRVFDTALTLGGALGLRHHALCSLCLLYAQLEVELTSRGASGSPETPPTASRAVHVLTTLAEGAVYTPFSGHVGPVTILKARKAYELALRAALLDVGGTAPSGRPHNVCGLVGCFGLFQYLTTGIDAAEAVYVQAGEALSGSARPSEDGGPLARCHVTSERETVAVQHVTLLHHHGNAGVLPLSRLRLALTEALHRLPCSAPLWQLYLLAESRCHNRGRTRRFFHDVAKSNRSVIPRLFAVTAEQRWKQQMDLAQSSCSSLPTDILPTLPEIGIGNRIRTLFEVAVTTEDGAHCPLLWRMYMTSLVSSGHTEKGRGIFYKALQAVPWAKGLYMDAVQLFPDRVQEFLDLLTEKELRLRVPLEEVDILLED